MKVKCVFNKWKELPEVYRKANNLYKEDIEFSLIKDKEYIVYGIINYSGGLAYLICDEDYMYYPMGNPAPLFDIIDNRLSLYWIFHYDRENNVFEFVFKEWVEDPYYYEKLIDGDAEAVSIFQRYKEAMDAEANIDQEVDILINILSKPLTKDARDNGWYEGSQEEVLNLLKQLKVDINKKFLISEDTKYLNLVKTVEVLGVDTGKLYELFVRIAEDIKNLKSLS